MGASCIYWQTTHHLFSASLEKLQYYNHSSYSTPSEVTIVTGAQAE